MADCVFLCACSLLVLSLKHLEKPDLLSHQKASLDPERNMQSSINCSSKWADTHSFHLLTWFWTDLRGGDKSSSDSFPLHCCLLGGDWSESEPLRGLGRILGGDWSESEALFLGAFFRGGDWSESKLSLFWVLFAPDKDNESGLWLESRHLLRKVKKR